MNEFIYSLEVEADEYSRIADRAEKYRNDIHTEFVDLQKVARDKIKRFKIPVYVSKGKRIDISKANRVKEKKKNKISRKKTINKPCKTSNIANSPLKVEVPESYEKTARVYVPPHPFIISPSMGGDGFDYQDYQHFTDIPSAKPRRYATRRTQSPFFARAFAGNSNHFNMYPLDEEENCYMYV